MMKRHASFRRRFLPYALAVLIVAGIFGWYQYSRYQYLIGTPVDPGDASNVSFLIKKGESLNAIADSLAEKNLILDAGAFKLYTKLGGHDRGVVAGRFILRRNLTIPEIVETITDAKKSEVIITIPEGSTIREIDEKLVELGVIEAGEFLAAASEFDRYGDYFFLNEEVQKQLPHPLEGYLFPDTYFLDPINFHSENMIQLMLDNFERKIGEELKNPGDRTIHEIVTMASIVEKEVRTSEDVPIVAGILWKRLDTGWMLGADATLLYLKEDRTINYEDLQQESPYNTRKNSGLPPGPISNPGLESLTATLHPQESPYWFYLTTLDTGEVIYAATNEEHNLNKAKHL